MVHHMKQMKNAAIVCNIGHFDNEIDMLGLEAYPGIKRITIKPQTDPWEFPETRRGINILSERLLMNLGCASGQPSFVMSCSFTNQVIAWLERYGRRREQANTGRRSTWCRSIWMKGCSTSSWEAWR